MKIYKTESPFEKKVQQVEALMLSLGLSIEWTHHGFQITDSSDKENNKTAIITDTEGRDTVTQFPRVFEHERLALPEP